MTDDYEYDNELELIGRLKPSYSRQFEITNSTVTIYNYSIMINSRIIKCTYILYELLSKAVII
jgi:hypothetical protein